MLVFDAMGLSLFCVTGADKAIRFGLGPAQTVILGAITGIGGGMLRDVLRREVPVVLRSELYAVPALAGASVIVVAHEVGSGRGAYAVAGAALCLAIRLVGLRARLNIPVARRERPDRAGEQ